MYLGIDLGTSNSAIATFEDGRAKIFKTPEGTDVMPSVIYRDRRGNQAVGVRAYDQGTLAPENTVDKFKRLLGTASRLRFASAGVEVTPEEASTEVLKALLGYALVEAGTNAITGAVVTIPAAFNQMQSEATLSAAYAAGLDRVALLQEPVAAAMAAMANSRNRSGLFLVYDLGGGTFDLALVQALDGSVTVLAHEGLNMLGGSNFDRIIVDNVVRPWLYDNFDLPGNFSADKRFARLLRVAKRAAELAKIDLSTRAATTINAADEIVRLEDQRGESIYIDVPLDRRTLDSLVADSVGETITLCRKLIEDNGYRHDDIDRIVLIGGPTKMPAIRHYVQSELGIAVEDVLRVDPMTAVAVGAAIYCEGRDWREGESSAKASRAAVETEGNIAVTYEYDARTADRRARLTIRGSSGSETATVQVDSEAGWTSGRRSLAEPVVLDLELADPGPNRFQALVFDARGRPVAEASKTLVVERLVATTTGIPATQTIAVRVGDGFDGDTLDMLVQKGAILPTNDVYVCRVAETRRAADPEPFRVDIFQLADERAKNPEHNLCVGQFEINGSELPDGSSLRKGEEVRIHWSMSEGQTLDLEIEIPSLGVRFDGRHFYNYGAGAQSFDGTEGEELVDDVLERAKKHLDEAEAAAPSSVSAALAPLRKKFQDNWDGARGTCEADRRKQITEEVRKIRQDVEALLLRPEARQQVLARRLDDWVRWYNGDVRAAASSEDNDRLDELARNARQSIHGGDKDSLTVAERQIREIGSLYGRAGLQQAGFCAEVWRTLRDTRHLARNRSRFDKIVVEGDGALAAANTADLRKAIFAVWDNQISTEMRYPVGGPASVMRR